VDWNEMIPNNNDDKINELLKKMGSPHKRSIHTLQEWYASQDPDSMEKLPQEVQDMRMLARYSMLTCVVGLMPLEIALSTIEMAIEAAYNLGKSAPKA